MCDCNYPSFFIIFLSVSQAFIVCIHRLCTNNRLVCVIRIIVKIYKVTLFPYNHSHNLYMGRYPLNMRTPLLSFFVCTTFCYVLCKSNPKNSLPFLYLKMHFFLLFACVSIHGIVGMYMWLCFAMLCKKKSALWKKHNGIMLRRESWQEKQKRKDGYRK